MAYTKIIKIQSRLDNTLNYAMNKDKNSLEETILESAINCMITHPYKDMMNTKKAKKKMGGILGYHIIQSFKPNETDPATAHKIGVEFAEKCFGEKYQVVVSTHLDRGHLHNHLIANSVSFVDGKKYKSEFNTYYNEIRKTSDDVCKEYNLSIIVPNKNNKSLSYLEWLEINRGKTTWQTIIRSDIDYAISTSYSFGEFLMDMEHMGYEIKQGKYLAVRPYGKERYSRCYKLGKGYGEDEIRDRIAGVKTKYVPPLKMTEYTKKVYSKALFMPNFIREYWRWMYSLNLVKKRQAPRIVSKHLKKDLLDIEKHKEQFRFQKAHSIDSEDKFYSYIKQLDEKISELYSKLHSLDNANKGKRKEFNALADIEKHKNPYEMYLQGYTMMRDEHDAYIKAQKVLKDNGYTSAADIAALKKEKVQLYEKRDDIKKDIRACKKDKRVCNDIQKSMDYIAERNRLIEQQKVVSKKKEHIIEKSY